MAKPDITLKKTDKNELERLLQKEISRMAYEMFTNNYQRLVERRARTGLDLRDRVTGRHSKV